MKIPLFVVWSAQNSALIWKSLYEFFDTRYPPLPLSATMAPPSARQLASPTGLKFSIPESPSTRVVQPPPDMLAQPKTPKPATNPITATDDRFMVSSFVGNTKPSYCQARLSTVFS